MAPPVWSSDFMLLRNRGQNFHDHCSGAFLLQHLQGKLSHRQPSGEHDVVANCGLLEQALQSALQVGWVEPATLSRPKSLELETLALSWRVLSIYIIEIVS